MRKIGIVTIVDYNNYGNRLQNYALQEFLKTFNYSVTTLVNIPYDSSGLEKINQVQKNKKLYKKVLRLKKFSFFSFINRKKIKKEKYENFISFSREFIDETNYLRLTPKEIDSYSYFVVGSDQIWNPYFREGNKNDFLQFAPVHKRLTYAPSFGVSQIPTEYRDYYRRWLTEFENLSVREKSGEKLIFELTQQKSQVLLDPTMMLSKTDWLKIFEPLETKTSKRYVLTYFLGDIPKAAKKRILSLKKEGLSVVNLAQIKDSKMYTVDPAEFLKMIHYSDFFLTDSYHGVVFSIIFEKLFIVYKRQDDTPSMDSRIDNLLEKFSLEYRRNENILDNDVMEIDYSNVQQIIKVEKIKSINFLSKHIN